MMGTGNRAVNTTHGAHALVGEKKINKWKQIEFQMVLVAYAANILHDGTDSKGKEAGLSRGQERSL